MVLKLKFSRIEFVLRVLVYCAALLSLFFIDLPSYLLLGCGILTCMAIAWDCFRVYYSRSRLLRISYNGDCWEVESNLILFEVRSLKIKFLSEFLIIVEFSYADVPFQLPNRLMLFSDSLAQAQWLQFRRFLRFEYSVPRH